MTPKGEVTRWDYVFDMVLCTLPSGETRVTIYEDGRMSDSRTYDANNHRIHSIAHLYDPKGDIQKVIQGEDQVTLTWMNSFGQPIKIQKGNIVESYEYDVCGNCTAIIDGEGETNTPKHLMD